MLAGEPPCVDRGGARLSEAEKEIARDLRFAERRRPGRGWMDRQSAKGHPVSRSDDHDAARGIGALRPGTEGGRRDRARIDEPRMRGHDDLRRDAAIGPSELASLLDKGAKPEVLCRIE